MNRQEANALDRHITGNYGEDQYPDQPKTFHRTVWTVEVLSDEPLATGLDLADIDYAITEGHCSGEYHVTHTEVLTGLEMAEALQHQGSDPEFFGLDIDGNQVED